MHHFISVVVCIMYITQRLPAFTYFGLQKPELWWVLMCWRNEYVVVSVIDPMTLIYQLDLSAHWLFVARLILAYRIGTSPFSHHMRIRRVRVRVKLGLELRLGLGWLVRKWTTPYRIVCYRVRSVLCNRRRHILAASVQRRTPDTNTRIQSSTTTQAYEETSIDLRPTPVYSKPYEPASSSSASSSAAASSPVIDTTGNVSSVYSDTTTTLIDNALYDVQQPPVTSSNVAETGDDVTDLTLIDNDLYERRGQQNSWFTDYECTQYTGWQWSVSLTVWWCDINAVTRHLLCTVSNSHLNLCNFVAFRMRQEKKKKKRKKRKKKMRKMRKEKWKKKNEKRKKWIDHITKQKLAQGVTLLCTSCESKMYGP